MASLIDHSEPLYGASALPFPTQMQRLPKQTMPHNPYLRFRLFPVVSISYSAATTNRLKTRRTTMLKLKTFDIPENPAPEECFLDLILDALHEKGRVPEETPDMGFGNYYVRENLDHLTLEKVSGGWVYNIIFKQRDGTEMNCVTLPVSKALPSAVDAFLCGASLTCLITTGFPTLPFERAGHTLVMASYGNNN
jgi:hypothetical protein